jgi:hypothetical protein
MTSCKSPANPLLKTPNMLVTTPANGLGKRRRELDSEARGGASSSISAVKSRRIDFEEYVGVSPPTNDMTSSTPGDYSAPAGFEQEIPLGGTNTRTLNDSFDGLADDCAPSSLVVFDEAEKVKGAATKFLNEEAACEERAKAAHRMQTAAYNKIGMSNAIEYGLLKVAIDHNMSQSAADSVIALVKQAIDSVESREKARCMPSSMVKFLQHTGRYTRGKQLNGYWYQAEDS